MGPRHGLGKIKFKIGIDPPGASRRSRLVLHIVACLNDLSHYPLTNEDAPEGDFVFVHGAPGF